MDDLLPVFPPELEQNELFGCVRTDTEGTIVAWNKGAESITGYVPREVLGKPIEILFTKEDNELAIGLKERTQAVAHGTSSDERWHLRKNGTCFWALGALVAVRNQSDKVIGFSKIFRDQTIRRKTEDELAFANAELTRFTYMVAHDLQAPLRTVVTYFEMAYRKCEKFLDPETKAYMEVSRSAAKTMRTLISDLLDYSQTKSKDQMKELVDCNAVFDVAVSNLRERVEATRATLGHDTLPIVKGVASQLMLLFQNLLGNALKYAKPKQPPRIQVRVRREADFWLFSVADNGVGIPKQDFVRVFETFERGESKGSQAGSGLGLAICKSIVEAHGGKIYLESEVGRGTTFFFTIRA